MNNYSGWEDYYKSNKEKSIWKEEVEPFLIENSVILSSNNLRIKILDIACGDGRNTSFFCNQNNIICCIDIHCNFFLAINCNTSGRNGYRNI